MFLKRKLKRLLLKSLCEKISKDKDLLDNNQKIKLLAVLYKIKD